MTQSADEIPPWLLTAKVISNIVWVEDPDSDWATDEEPRELPDECECFARHNDDLRSWEEPYKCDCPDYKIIHIPPSKRAMWEVVILDPNPNTGICGSGFGQSQEEAHRSAIAAAIARRLNQISD